MAKNKTTFTASDLREILARYDLGEYQKSRPFERGADQTNVLLQTTAGRYAFKYYEKRSKAYVSFEIDLLAFLGQRSFLCPAPISNRKGKFLGQYKNKPFAIFEFMDGKHSAHGRNRKAVARAIGELHSITAGFKPKHAVDRDAYDAKSCWASATTNAKKMRSRAKAKERLAWLKTELDKLEVPKSLPVGVCHGDPNPHNFLYKNRELSAVLDFDQSSYVYLLYDVALLLYWWAWPNKGKLDFAKAKEITREYERYRKLASQEKQHLYDLLKIVIFMGVGWFIEQDGFLNDQRKIELLNSVGRDEFCQRIFYK